MTTFWSIEEFPNLTAQEIFERSVRHVLKNGAPSAITENCRSRCLYQGIGCGAAPFLTPEGCRLADNGGDGGAGLTWRGLVSQKRVPASEHHDLIIALQSCHDGPAIRGSGINPDFIEEYVENVVRVAEAFQVSVQNLNLPTPA